MRKENGTERLTILPRLNSLNHEPGVSFGQLDILTYQKEKRAKSEGRCHSVNAGATVCQHGRRRRRSETPLKITPLLHCHLSYPCGLLIWVDARFSTCGEVAEDFDGVSCAALIRINPVFTWETENKCDTQPPRRK